MNGSATASCCCSKDTAPAAIINRKKVRPPRIKIDAQLHATRAQQAFTALAQANLGRGWAGRPDFVGAARNPRCIESFGHGPMLCSDASFRQAAATALPGGRMHFPRTDRPSHPPHVHRRPIDRDPLAFVGAHCPGRWDDCLVGYVPSFSNKLASVDRDPILRFCARASPVDRVGAARPHSGGRGAADGGHKPHTHVAARRVCGPVRRIALGGSPAPRSALLGEMHEARPP